MELTEMQKLFGMDPSGSGQDSLTSSCEHGFHKRRGISQPADGLMASEELRAIQLIISCI
jgi:hypothetical protein